MTIKKFRVLAARKRYANAYRSGNLDIILAPYTLKK